MPPGLLWFFLRLIIFLFMAMPKYSGLSCRNLQISSLLQVMNFRLWQTFFICAKRETSHGRNWHFFFWPFETTQAARISILVCGQDPIYICCKKNIPLPIISGERLYLFWSSACLISCIWFKTKYKECPR